MFNSIVTFLQGKKTYLTGAVAILSTLIALGDGKVDLVQAAQVIVPAIMGMTIRHGVSTSTTQ
jgi:hypothetical protein